MKRKINFSIFYFALCAILFALCVPLVQAQKADNVTNPAKVDGVAGAAKWIGVTVAGGDTTPPTISSATLDSTGSTVTFAFDETVNFGAGGNGGFAVTTNGNAVTLTYASGAPGSSLVYNTSRVVLSNTTTLNYTYTQPGNGIEDTSGNDLANKGSTVITNNSTVTYLSAQGFETPTTGYDHGETWTTTGTPNPVYTTTILDGENSSGYTDSTSETQTFNHTLVAGTQAEVWGYTMIRFVALPNSITPMINIRDSAGSKASVKLDQGGTLYFTHGTTTSSGTTNTVSTGVTYHIVWYYKDDGPTGHGSVEFSTDGTFPGSGTKYTSVATGTSTAPVDRMFYGTNTAQGPAKIIWDKIRVKNVAIGSNPP